MLNFKFRGSGFIPYFTVFMCLWLSSGMALGAEKSELTTLFRLGKIFIQQDEKYVEAPEKGLLKNTILRVGEVIESRKLLKDPQQLSKNQLVITYSGREMLTLATGTKVIRRLSKEKTPEYQINGTAHLFILKQKKEKRPFIFSLNKIPISTNNSHLFVNDLKAGGMEITVVEGTVQLFIPGDVIDIRPNEKVKLTLVGNGQDGEKKKYNIKLVALDRLVVKKETVEIHHKVSLKGLIYKHSIVPGFEANGSYISTGFAKFSKKPIQITRNKKVSQLFVSPVVLFVGDEILTKSKQRAILSLRSKDKIRLYGNTKFIIEQFEFGSEEKNPSILMSFLGKIRAKISKRKRRGKIRFKTATAVIGIKGTDFEATASNSGSEVATVEGTVGVSDVDGKGEVEVKAGQLTTVAAGALPAKPTPIPPERLKALNQSGLGIDPEDIIPLEGVSVTLPEEGVTHSKGVFSFQVIPENASIEFLLDNEINLQLLQGYDLSSLGDGKHSITIRGLGENPLSKTISFFIDQSEPQLVASSKLEEMILKEGEPLSLDWSEELRSVKLILPGQVVLALIDQQNKKRSVFKTETIFKAFVLKTEAIINLEITDLNGNISKVSGKIKLQAKPVTPKLVVKEKIIPKRVSKKPREISLKENFQDSILNRTGKYNDQILLVDRPLFQLNNIKPLPVLKKGVKLKSFDFKVTKPSGPRNTLEDPFLNSF